MKLSIIQGEIMSKKTISLTQTKKKQPAKQRYASKTEKSGVRRKKRQEKQADLKIETKVIPEKNLEFKLFNEEALKLQTLNKTSTINKTAIKIKKTDLAKNKVKAIKEKHADKKFLGSTDSKFLESLENKMKANLVEIENYEVLKDTVTVKIVSEEGNFYYLIKEPPLSKSETALLELLKESIIQLSEGTKQPINQQIDQATKRFMIPIPNESLEKIKYFIRRDFLGYGIIDAIMHDPQIEDISCNGTQSQIYVHHRKYGSIETNIGFDELEQLKSYVVRLSQQCNKFISFAEPLMDGTLPDGSRVQSTYGAGITVNGPTFSIRKITKTPLTPLDLIRFKTLSPEMVAYFWLVIENKMNMLISGGTATGKTAMLNSLAMFIPENLKIVSVEDTSELNLIHKNWIHSISRPGYGPADAQGNRYGEVSLFDLVKASLRQRPDYLIVGEVRGQEAYTLFQGMATGHAGLGTFHAKSLESIIDRLTMPPINLPSSLLELLDVVAIQTLAPEYGNNARRSQKVLEIAKISKTHAYSNTVFEWKPAKDNYTINKKSLNLEKIAHHRGMTYPEIKKELKRRAKFLKAMSDKKVDFEKFNTHLRNYRRDPENTLDRLKGKTNALKKVKGKIK
ncbi:MAG: type II/IV secretion system ATPase subunit [Candidatus Diapherotrites archaeon]|nr:type II/IV secretion system ATPase subunit [Candidatus Diapherotrites archaeon]